MIPSGLGTNMPPINALQTRIRTSRVTESLNGLRHKFDRAEEFRVFEAKRGQAYKNLGRFQPSCGDLTIATSAFSMVPWTEN